MMLKDLILKKLEDTRGEFVSGEALAEAFGVSRNAVWKCVKRLEKEGYAVTSVKNRGYALSPQGDELSAFAVEKYLREGAFFVEVKKSTFSTNDDVKKLAAQGAPAWSAVIAEEQAGGRGRFGRAFYSPAGNGLYMSVLLRPHIAAGETLFITTCAAVAVAEAVEKLCGKYAEIKWVNDVFIGGKKVSGILTEASFNVESGGLDYAVVGIGINVRGAFPPALADIATSAFGEGECPPQARARLAAEVLTRLRHYCEHIGERLFYPEYLRRSLVIGRRVRVLCGDTEREAEALGLDENCFLKVRYDDGTCATLAAGEVSLKV